MPKIANYFNFKESDFSSFPIYCLLMVLMKPINPDSRTVAIMDRVAGNIQNYLIEMNSGVAWVPVENQPGWTRFNLRKEDIAGDQLYVYEDANGTIDYKIPRFELVN